MSRKTTGFETAGRREFRPRRWSVPDGSHTSADAYDATSPGKSIRAELHPANGPARLVETACRSRRSSKRRAITKTLVQEYFDLIEELHVPKYFKDRKEH